jgi:iron complex transport system permease protein
MAALGAVIALYFGWSAGVPLAALISTVLGALLVIGLVRRRQGRDVLVLAGVGVGALATAVTGLAMNFAPNPWALSEIAYWLMGSLRNADADAVMLAGGLTVLGIAMLMFAGKDLRTLTLGEDTARTLGVNLRAVQIILIIGVALCVGSGVAVAGAIGFVGLFVPHLVRFTITTDPARLIPLSAIAGAGTLAIADLIAKGLSGPGTQLYLGILTSLIGVPIFLWLAVRRT